MPSRGIRVLSHDQDAYCGPIGVEYPKDVGESRRDNLASALPRVELGEDFLEQGSVAVNQRTPRGVNLAGQFVEVHA